MSIPFDIPARFMAGLSSGELQRFGGIIKDAGSGQIVGHLQETGVLQSVLRSGLSFDPTGVTGLIGVAQNAAISHKLNAMQAMMGTLQTLQIATLASSVVGIGVTAASTAIILQRLRGIDQRLERIEGTLAELPRQWQDMELRKKLLTMSTSLERLQEAEYRPDAESVARAEEERLNYVFGDLHGGLCNVVIEAKIDPALLQCLLAGLSLSADAQFKALLWLDMKEAAGKRAVNQFAKLRELGFRMPRHSMAERLAGDGAQAMQISSDFSEIRMRAASQPQLARTLIAQGINGREFIDQIQNEDTQPILILPYA
ncbi:hypothetical protein [Paracoccus sp. DMF]|uniref:hypothetical protein n=1 Tax=Paracoccus sp. DMF TaxID=400837 RepID=UPI0011002DBB|nr:hypothetical protein [Paracoccus sp. DMF]MCV2445999.1 hypothetical protein [Paracoccus sp. DMF]